MRGGLSPLARGTHDQVPENAGCTRFIPAGAGNTSALYGGTSRQSVYPRWRGEHGAVGIGRAGGHGLSPLARGTQRRFASHYARQRFIPAGAGNTILTPRFQNPVPVYPRWRGEHNSDSRGRNRQSGLSPLARGTRFEDHAHGYPVRFIPAGAGNTATRSMSARLRTVYPRWRGEHEPVMCCQSLSAGLSPLARGTR